MSYRRRRSPLEFVARTLHQLTRALAQLVWAACLPFLVIVDLWTALLHTGRRSLRQLGRVNILRLLLVYLRLPFLELLRASRWMFASVIGWWPRVSMVHLLQGLPAVVALLLTTLPLVIAKGKEMSVYALAADDAYREHDFEKAEIYYRALVDKEPNSEIFRCNLAMSVEGLHDHERAVAIMRGLASPQKQGYPHAHYWLATDWIATHSPWQEGWQEAEAHLKRAIQGSPNFADAHAQLGVLYLNLRRYREAEPHLLQAKKPELWLRIAQLRLMQGDMKKAQEDGENAVNYYRAKAEADLDDVHSRVCWAVALGFLGRYDVAVAVLEDGMKYSSDPQLPRMLGNMCLRWAEVLRKGGGTSTSAQQQMLLVRAFHYSPTDAWLLRAVILGVKGEGQDPVLFRSVLRTLLSQGQSLGIVDMLLAVDAEARHQTSSADNYLRKARELDPRVPALLGQVAISFSETLPNPLLGEGFALANLGLHAWPHDPDVLYARGNLYQREGKWIESLIDLEAALPKKGDNPEVHRLLANAYQQLGMQDKAEVHRERETAAR